MFKWSWTLALRIYAQSAVDAVTGGIAPIILPPTGVGPHRPLARPPLPLAPLREKRARPWLYTVSTLDNRGRVADASVVRALGWAAGTRLSVREQGGLVVVRKDDQGVFRTSTTGHLLISAPVRQWCGLRSGDRVLLAGDAGRDLIVVHPPEAIDAMVEQLHGIRLGEGP